LNSPVVPGEAEEIVAGAGDHGVVIVRHHELVAAVAALDDLVVYIVSIETTARYRCHLLPLFADVAAILISFEFSFTSVVVNRGLSEGSKFISNLLQSV